MNKIKQEKGRENDRGNVILYRVVQVTLLRRNLSRNLKKGVKVNYSGYVG